MPGSEAALLPPPRATLPGDAGSAWASYTHTPPSGCRPAPPAREQGGSRVGWRGRRASSRVSQLGGCGLRGGAAATAQGPTHLRGRKRPVGHQRSPDGKSVLARQVTEGLPRRRAAGERRAATAAAASTAAVVCCRSARVAVANGLARGMRQGAGWTPTRRAASEGRVGGSRQGVGRRARHALAAVRVKCDAMRRCGAEGARVQRRHASGGDGRCHFRKHCCRELYKGGMQALGTDLMRRR